MSRWIAAVALAMLLAGAPVASQEEPRESSYREEVRVELVQIEVTVWPKKETDLGLCTGLGSDDFEVTINGRAREIEAVDWLGSEEAIRAEAREAVQNIDEPPLTMVLFFDLWHLNIFYRRFTACPITQPLAFDQARELVREQFKTGDRLLLVTFAGWPQIHEGWIRDPAHALRALDRLEVNQTVQSARRQHSHHQEWIKGMKSLLLALGRYPGRKELFYLADDFRFDDVSLQVFDLAARAQANGVTMHAVDLVAGCRSVPGPGCPGVRNGGLGCTEFRIPAALGYVAVNGGGRVFKGGQTLSDAVGTVRRMRGCRYLISFPMEKRKRKHSPKAIVRVKRKGVQLQFPSSFGSPSREPTEREEQHALFLLPRFGEGLEAQIGLWPLRPSGKRNRWKGVMIARLQRGGEEPWPAGLEKIEIEAMAHRSSKVYERFRKVIEGPELARFRDGESRLFVFPLDGIRPGRNTAVLRAVGVGGEVSANIRSELDLPEPPGPGKAAPWFLVDRLARAGGIETVLPALDGILAEGSGGLIIGYGCRGEGSGFDEARLIALDGAESRSVPIDWLEPPDETASTADACGWLAAPIDRELERGLWRFEPPAALEPAEGESSVVEFRIAPVQEGRVD